MDLQEQAIDAVQKNNIELLDQLSKDGLDLKKVRDYQHWTLCHFAAYANNANILYYLHNLGHDLDHSHYGGPTPLYVAAINNATDATLYLVQMGVNINKRYTLNGYTPFFMATWSNSVGVMQILKENGCDLSLEANDSFRKETPAFIAARWGRLEAIKLLHTYGCDLTACNVDGNTPEFIAYHFGHDDCGNYLATNNVAQEQSTDINSNTNSSKREIRNGSF